MTAVLIVAHAPLASAMLAVAEHCFAGCASQVMVQDVQPDHPNLVPLLAATLRTQLARHQQVLMLADVPGATPCNAAAQAAQLVLHERATQRPPIGSAVDLTNKTSSDVPEGVPIGLVSGLNVPMVWRTLGRLDLPLPQLIQRAVQGAVAATTAWPVQRPADAQKPGPRHEPQGGCP